MMPIKTRLMLLGMASLVNAAPAAAQRVIDLLPTSNQDAVIAALRPGDTLRLVGTFETPVRFRNRDFGGVTVDGRNAVMREGAFLQNVQNISVIGGVFGRTDRDTRDWGTLRIDNSSHVSVSGATVVGNGNSLGAGIRIARSDYVTVRDNNLSGHLGAIMLLSSTNSLIARNHMTASASDGIQIVDSHRSIVSANTCNWSVRVGNNHPDCIQFWSVGGRPLVSEIFVLNNSAIGNMQAFFGGPGTQLTFAGNYAAVLFTHTISCGNCTHSSFFDNVLANLPDAARAAGTLKVGTSPTNTIGTNMSYDLRGRTDGWLPPPTWTSFVPNIAGLVGSRWDDRSFGFRLDLGEGGGSSAAVPEPASWLMLWLGFLAVGRQLRLRQRQSSGPKWVAA
ncbi:NosD domain-containing protein [Sandarakinorhabdus sp. AAP62]|uniref:NosD domain-containing protein n=1 Tax=Sandarakinorhabdus sp. AAP62 TaxID=1248916 RepID=UPI00187C6A5B|nr:NosD domain-containing protein [Sandarakinorhabdus sp. AAP62]